jgi:hypothetical protein
LSRHCADTLDNGERGPVLFEQFDQRSKVHVAFRLAVPLDCQRRHVFEV